MYTEWFSLIYEPVINLKTSNCIFLITEVNISIVFKVAHESCIESGKRVQLHVAMLDELPVIMKGHEH